MVLPLEDGVVGVMRLDSVVLEEKEYLFFYVSIVHNFELCGLEYNRIVTNVLY